MTTTMTKTGPRLRVVAAILAPLALLGALLSWALASPPGSSPDEDYHMASIWCAGGPSAGVCEETDSVEKRRLPADLVEAALCFRFYSEQAASCPLDEGMQTTDRGNWNGHAYPPVFFQAMNVFVGDDLSISIVAMRIVNSVLFVAVLTGLFVLLPRRQRHLLGWGTAISLVPLGMFLVASVNPSGWSVLSAAGLWLAIWGFFEQSGAKKWMLAAMSAALVVIGAGARSDSAIYAVVAMAAGTVLAFRADRRFALHALLPLALSVLSVVLFFSTGQSAIVSSDTAVDGKYPLSTLAFMDAKLLPQLWAGVFGLWGLGWLDTFMPGIVWITTLGLFCAVVFWGLRTGGIRKWLSLGGVAFCLVAVPMYILLHDNVVIGEYVQPRYIYPLIIIFGGVALAGVIRPNLGLSRLQITIAALGLAIANSVALHVNIRRYVTGLDVQSFNLDLQREWWWGGPVTPMMVWLAGSVAFTMAAAALAFLVWRRIDGQPVGLDHGQLVQVEDDVAVRRNGSQAVASPSSGVSVG
ncbi:DUF2142 domain-containing protein [Agromyces badenianii]|uniref:DUF2142 domain-containing protein n=1 Tax=Agromyces badenianii TaxID=2080742 RepID=UPI00143D844D|nr:DUF2142 domain-containing protein [Agromyces badenianii]